MLVCTQSTRDETLYRDLLIDAEFQLKHYYTGKIEEQCCGSTSKDVCGYKNHIKYKTAF